jgi:hypothetical protein
MTPPLRVPRRARAQSAGDRPGLGGRRSVSSGASRRLALHMLRQHASVSRTLAHHDVWTAPPHPRPRQDSKPALHRASRAARSARRLRHAQLSGGTCRRPGAQRPRPSAPSAQREAATGLPKAPGRAARPCHRSQARSARRRWQPAAALPGARRAAPSRLERSAERETAIRLTARALARSARAIGAERAARGAALAEPAVPHCAL